MWLRNIKDVIRYNQQELEAIADEEARNDRLVELNVREQVYNLAKTTIIQRSWKREERPDLHGWVYSLKDGLIKQVFDMKPGASVNAIYEYEV
jgi:carbonic anhydrase